ncbi:hypothetical protein [Thermopetrobacter sp. TC1]|uniref:hypothetical protein n=1 Tax=Thermopetrobacter sp. TC1 TaxID=1495045 RepID=UPI00056F2444|nr:hypothetical protein [Thermopetrobacter sp. TC1]
MLRAISAFPLLTFVLAAFNVVFWMPGVSLESILLKFVMPSGALLEITMGDILLIAALLILFFETLKSTGTSNLSILDHILSTGVFVLALVEFLLVPQAGNAWFLMLVIICFMDVAAGYAVSIRAARRDVSVK